jgi:hypothetical protein
MTLFGTYLPNFALGKSLLSYLRRSYACSGLLVTCYSSSVMPEAQVLNVQQTIACVPQYLRTTALQLLMLRTGTRISIAGKY